ncbi:MAG: hypothetical protein M0T75_08390 [Chloroflexi bacterium]|nr:hypothetical protein [Chloroflexota bacterium]
MRGDSGFYAHAAVETCRAIEVRFSITIRMSKGLHHLIAAIPEEDWTR